MNNKYFHGCVIKRRKQNGIDGMIVNGVWIEDADMVKKFTKEFFSNKFEEEQWARPRLELNDFK